MATDQQKKLAKVMLALNRCKKRNRNLKDWGLPENTTRFIENDPNALLLSAVFNRQIDYRKALEAPMLLKERLGHLDVRKIANMRPERLEKYIGKYRGGETLHRFPLQMAVGVIKASKLLIEKYKCYASNIWGKDPGAEEVLRRLKEFWGIGQKIANMMARLLITDYGVKLTGWKNIDIAVDRHVGRVFLRTGLVTGKMESSIGEIRDAVIGMARELSPRFPGALDEPTWMIGDKWCTAEEAYCYKEDEPCPLVDICTKRRRAWSVK